MHRAPKILEALFWYLVTIFLPILVGYAIIETESHFLAGIFSFIIGMSLAVIASLIATKLSEANRELNDFNE